MRIGIFGTADDPQCKAVAREAHLQGVETLLIPSDALDLGVPVSFTKKSISFGGESIDDIRSFYVREVPLPHVALVEDKGDLRLYEDWFITYMQSRERASCYLSWLLRLERDGVAVINPPQAGSVLQLKPYQLHVLEKVGARIPRTLISNDPVAVQSFAQEVQSVIFKPLMGGALTRELDDEALKRLELIRASPVIFQERIYGDDVRVIIADGKIISAVAVDTPVQQLDFRGDPVYSGGKAAYREVQLPDEIKLQCAQAAQECGLRFAGIDIKHKDDRWVFLELNSSPIYLDVELKLGHPITRALTGLLIQSA